VKRLPRRALIRKAPVAPLTVMIFPGMVPKSRRAQTFLATIRADHIAMKTLAMIFVLALITISGAVISDQILTSGQAVAQHTN
jgi:hypothetical protein